MRNRHLSGIDGLFRLRRPLSALLWTKYPNSCHACYTRRVSLPKQPERWTGEPQECDCILTLAETEERSRLLTPKEKQKAHADRRRYAVRTSGRWCDYNAISLTKLEDRFAYVFRRNTFALDLEAISFHFLEEVGEVVEALTSLYTYNVRKRTPVETLHTQWEARLTELEEELADSFSWLLAVSSKFREVFDVFDTYRGKKQYGPQMYVAQHLRSRHMGRRNKLMVCALCRRPIWRCPIKLITDPESADTLVR